MMEATPNTSEGTALLVQRAALSMRTVADQQQIIVGLQALVEALKGRVLVLEAAQSPPHAPAGSRSDVAHAAALSELSELQEEADRLRTHNARLVQTVAAMQSQRAALTRELQSTADEVNALTETVAQQQSVLARGEAQEVLRQKEHSLLQLTQAQKQQAEAELAILRDDLQFERQAKAKWRALAGTLCERVDASMQGQLQQRLFTLREEERRYMAQRDVRVHASAVPPRRSLVADQSRPTPAPAAPQPTPSPAARMVWSRSAASATVADTAGNAPSRAEDTRRGSAAESWQRATW